MTAAAGFYGSSIGKQLGLTDHASAYDHFWKSRGFIPVGPNGETQSIQSMLSQKANREAHKGFIVEKVHEHFIGKDAVTAATVSAGIPLMYDPEILDLLNASTPALAQFPQVGWNGTGYRGMNIAARGAALGFLTEAESMNITKTPRDSLRARSRGHGQVGIVSVSITAACSGAPVQPGRHRARYPDHRTQLQEQAVLYGDPAQEDDYGIGDARPRGFAKKFIDASAATDRARRSLPPTPSEGYQGQAEGPLFDLQRLSSRHPTSTTSLTTS